MATCKKCGKSGFLMKIFEDGLCKDCHEKSVKESLILKTQKFQNNDINKLSVGGYIKYYSLENWWLTEFDKDERKFIAEKVKNSINLIEGNIGFSSQLKVDFLSGLLTWFRKESDKPIAEKIKKKLEEISDKEPLDKKGYYKGRHYSSYSEDIKDLIRDGNLEKAEILLYHCVDATEAESKKEASGVAPFFYDKLALIYRKQNDLDKEYQILERYSKQQHAPGSMPQKLMDRFEKVKKLLAEDS